MKTLSIEIGSMMKAGCMAKVVTCNCAKAVMQKALKTILPQKETKQLFNQSRNQPTNQWTTIGIVESHAHETKKS